MGSNIRDDLISPVLLQTPGTCRSCWCFATEVVVPKSSPVSQEALSQRIVRRMVHHNENVHNIKHRSNVKCIQYDVKHNLVLDGILVYWT